MKVSSLFFWFFIFFSVFFSMGSFAFSGSIIDPALSHSITNSGSSDSRSSLLHGIIKTKITRNMRIASDDFMSASRKDGFFDTLYIKNDFILSYPASEAFSFLEKSFIFNKADLFFVLNYGRPVYASSQEIDEYCWNSIFCFGNIDLGVSRPIFQTDRFLADSSVYLRVPFSRSAFNQSFLVGLGMLLDTNYRFFSRSHFILSSFSSHSVSVSSYLYRTANVHETRYNKPLKLFNQLGLRFQHSKYKLIPVLLIYGYHYFTLNFKGTLIHSVTLSMSASWSVNNRIRLFAGLDWGDRILKPKNSALAVETKMFNPDYTYINLGGSYSF